jgi:hypothetical protein
MPNDDDPDRNVPSPPPAKLDYRAGSEDRPPHFSRFFSVMFGGGVFIFVAGFAVASVVSDQTMRLRSLPAGLMFFGMAGISLLCVAGTRVASVKPYLAGFLVGIAVAALIEGWCFVSVV